MTAFVDKRSEISPPKPGESRSLKSFLLHEDELVREAVCFYFFQSFSHDEQLVPLVLEACHRFGDERNEASLGFAGRFPLSPDSISLVFEKLQQAREPLLVYLFSDWIARAPLSAIDRLDGLIRRAPRIWPQSIARISRRRVLRELPLVSLWQSLYELDVTAPKPGGPVAPVRLSATGGKAEELLEAIAAQEREGVLKLEVVARLEAKEPQARRLHGAKLAGLARVQEAIPFLVPMLGEPDPAASHAVEALVRIGDPAAIGPIASGFERGSPVFASPAASVLAGLKHPDAEKAIVDLLEDTLGHHRREVLLSALRFQPSELALARLKTAIREDARGLLARELKKAAFVVSLVLGKRCDDELEAWREEMEANSDTHIQFFLGNLQV